MVRTQIQLEEDQVRRIKDAARLEGISMAEMVRRCVDAALPALSNRRAERYARALQALGRYSAGREDLAEHHDAYLGDAFE